MAKTVNNFFCAHGESNFKTASMYFHSKLTKTLSGTLRATLDSLKKTKSGKT